MAGPILVLVVDDEADVRFTIRRTLEPEFTVIEAENADAAVAAALKHKPALILLDVAMPGKGGLDVLPDIKLALPQARVVMLTGERDMHTVSEALKNGASAYVTKPFDVEQLRAEARGHEVNTDDRPWRVKL